MISSLEGFTGPRNVNSINPGSVGIGDDGQTPQDKMREIVGQTSFREMLECKLLDGRGRGGGKEGERRVEGMGGEAEGGFIGGTVTTMGPGQVKNKGGRIPTGRG